MNINTDTHYLFRMTNMNINRRKMKINTDTHYLFRMTNMEDEHKQ